MPLAVWIALAVFLVATSAGAAYGVIRGFQAWQTFRAAGRALEEAVNDLLDRLTRVEQRAAALGSSAPRVQDALGRLAQSRAMLSAELRVVEDVCAPFTRLRAAAFPRR
jgi:hypothetical protein